MKQMITCSLLANLCLAAVLLGEPTTAPALRASDLHGEWKLDRKATIDRAVAAAPEKEKERVREELNMYLPEQTFNFSPDGTYKVTSTMRSQKPTSDAGKYTLKEGSLHLVSSGVGQERDLAVVLEDGALVMQDTLVFRR